MFHGIVYVNNIPLYILVNAPGAITSQSPNRECKTGTRRVRTHAHHHVDR